VTIVRSKQRKSARDMRRGRRRFVANGKLAPEVLYECCRLARLDEIE
jgi:hypothetical protein